MMKATFAAGCFWGVEAAFKKIKGVVSTTVGYTGGSKKDPSYEDICSGDTGHAEAVLVEYDPEKVSYERLLDVFWQIHEPTSLDKQGNDIGSQYRAVIFYHDEAQKRSAERSLKEKQKEYDEKIMTQIKKAEKFYKAEDYHQDYLDKNKGGYCHIDLNSIE
ncbi:peptide-methionine (S)-S-oxide reductase MsrA [Candidatus Woesearchaeota archaeon]|nr:peptide-methionine (S)-S-oxide reductase MsrA [Candidatus Woesearchaeota archaeon]